MKTNITVNIIFGLNELNLKKIIEEFKKCIFSCFQEIVIKVLRHFALEYMFRIYERWNFSKDIAMFKGHMEDIQRSRDNQYFNNFW